MSLNKLIIPIFIEGYNKKSIHLAFYLLEIIKSTKTCIVTNDKNMMLQIRDNVWTSLSF